MLLHTAESKMFLFLKFRYTVSIHFYVVLLGVYHSLFCLSSCLGNHASFQILALSSIRFQNMKRLTHKITSPQSLHPLTDSTHCSEISACTWLSCCGQWAQGTCTDRHHESLEDKSLVMTLRIHSVTFFQSYNCLRWQFGHLRNNPRYHQKSLL